MTCDGRLLQFVVNSTCRDDEGLARSSSRFLRPDDDQRRCLVVCTTIAMSPTHRIAAAAVISRRDMHAPALHRRRFMQCNVLFLSLSHRRKARPGRPSGGQQRRRLLPCAALVAPRHGLVDWTSLVNHHTPQLPRPPAIGCPSCHRPVVRPARCVAPAIGQRFRLRTCLQLSGSLQKSQGKHQHWLHGERSESEMLSMLVRCTSAQSTFLPLCTCIASHHAVSSAPTRRAATPDLS